MKTWLLRAALLVVGIVLGYVTVFTVRFLVGVLPHGGMW